LNTREAGTIEPLPSGRFRVRVRMPNGDRKSCGTYATEAEAEGILGALLTELAESAPLRGVTVRAMLAAWEEALELSRSYVAMANVRSIRKRWLDSAPFADMPVASVSRREIQAWAGSLRALGPSYARQALTHLRSAFAWANDHGLTEENPARDVRIPRRAARTEDPWTYLQPEEQAALIGTESVTEELRVMAAFAIGTGLRMGEQLSLRLADLHVGENPRVVVRYGSKKRAPRGRRIRTVPLFGLGLEAAKRWLQLLPAYCPKNPDRLAFPGPKGGFQKVSRIPGWKEWLTAAGIDRRVRWHDLRHTCAASLISGWWGPAWRLEEVRDLLGHHSVRMTERYAHLGASALKQAADRTSGPRVVHEAPQALAATADGSLPRHPPLLQKNAAETSLIRRIGPNPWTASLVHAEQLLRSVDGGGDCSGALLALAASVLAAEPVRLAFQVQAGGPHAIDRGLELARLVLSSAADSESKRAGGES
jgi:integrase